MGNCQASCCAKEHEIIIKENYKSEVDCDVGNPDDLKEENSKDSKKSVEKPFETPRHTKEREKF